MLIVLQWNQYCGSGMFIADPGSKFFHPGSRIQGQKDSQIRIRNTEWNIHLYLLSPVFEVAALWGSVRVNKFKCYV